MSRLLARRHRENKKRHKQPCIQKRKNDLRGTRENETTITTTTTTTTSRETSSLLFSPSRREETRSDRHNFVVLRHPATFASANERATRRRRRRRSSTDVSLRRLQRRELGQQPVLIPRQISVLAPSRNLPPVLALCPCFSHPLSPLSLAVSSLFRTNSRTHRLPSCFSDRETDLCTRAEIP